MSNIIILGSGYVGLVTAMGLKSYGHNVICIDTDEDKIIKLNQGICPIYEKDLSLKGIYFSTDIKSYIQESDFIFLCIGTPSGQDGSCDTDNLFKAVRNFAPILKKYTVIVNKSTVPVGTCFKIKEIIQDLSDADFDIVSNPEFLKEGEAVHDFLCPDRIVIGHETKRARSAMRDLYYRPPTYHNIIFMDILSAELTKYAANAMLATRISFMNELALLCDKIGADINQVKKGIGADSRIGEKFLNAGIGYGGSCFPKDIDALLHTFYKHGINNKILAAVKSVNHDMRDYFIEKMEKHFGDLNGLKIAIWGLAFKPETDDTRCAPARTVIENLLFFHCDITVYDPVVKDIGIEGVKYGKNKTECLINADCLLILTEWQEFKNENFEYIKHVDNKFIIFDGRNIYEPEKMRELGFIYYGIGR